MCVHVLGKHYTTLVHTSSCTLQASSTPSVDAGLGFGVLLASIAHVVHTGVKGHVLPANPFYLVHTNNIELGCFFHRGHS